MGWKRKSSSPGPQPNPAKAPKRESLSRSSFSVKLSPSSWRRKISTPTKNKSWISIQTLSPEEKFHPSNCHEQNFNGTTGSVDTSRITWVKFRPELDIWLYCMCVGHGEDESVQISPISSPLQSEEDAELGLVITVGESGHIALPLTTLHLVMLLSN